MVTDAHSPLLLTRFGRIIIFFFCLAYSSSSIVEKLTYARWIGYFFTIWLILILSFPLIMFVIGVASRASVRTHLFFNLFSRAFLRFELESVVEVFLKLDFLFYRLGEFKIGIFKKGSGLFWWFDGCVDSDRNLNGSGLFFCCTKKLCWVLAQASSSDMFHNWSLRW